MQPTSNAVRRDATPVECSEGFHHGLLGLVSRLPVTAADVCAHRDRYVRERNLTTWSFHNPQAPLEQVDVIIPYNLEGRPVSRIAMGDGSVAVLSAAALIEMKRASGRPQDLEDARALEKLR